MKKTIWKKCKEAIYRHVFNLVGKAVIFAIIVVLAYFCAFNPAVKKMEDGFSETKDVVLEEVSVVKGQFNNVTTGITDINDQLSGFKAEFSELKGLLSGVAKQVDDVKTTSDHNPLTSHQQKNSPPALDHDSVGAPKDGGQQIK